jgi:hypothetical protein
VNDRDEPSAAARRPGAVAGEIPHSLRNRLKDADRVDSAKLSDEREELQSAARDRQPEEPVKKRRRWRARS